MACHKALKDARLQSASQSELFKDFHNLQGVWTHPLMLAMKNKDGEMRHENDDSETEIESDDNSSSNEPGTSDSKKPAKLTSDWWKAICPAEEFDNIECSAKLMLLFSIIAECSDRGEKLLVFSQSLFTLNVIEHFLSVNDSAAQWKKGLNYFRLDGSTNIKLRTEYCRTFNDEQNTEARLVSFETSHMNYFQK